MATDGLLSRPLLRLRHRTTCWCGWTPAAGRSREQLAEIDSAAGGVLRAGRVRAARRRSSTGEQPIAAALSRRRAGGRIGRRGGGRPDLRAGRPASAAWRRVDRRPGPLLRRAVQGRDRSVERIPHEGAIETDRPVARLRTDHVASVRVERLGDRDVKRLRLSTHSQPLTPISNPRTSNPQPPIPQPCLTCAKIRSSAAG